MVNIRQVLRERNNIYVTRLGRDILYYHKSNSSSVLTFESLKVYRVKCLIILYLNGTVIDDLRPNGDGIDHLELRL